MRVISFTLLVVTLETDVSFCLIFTLRENICKNMLVFI